MNIKTKFDIDDEVIIISNNKLVKTKISHLTIMVNDLQTSLKPIDIVYDTLKRNNIPENQIYDSIDDIQIN